MHTQVANTFNECNAMQNTTKSSCKPLQACVFPLLPPAVCPNTYHSPLTSPVSREKAVLCAGHTMHLSLTCSACVQINVCVYRSTYVHMQHAVYTYSTHLALEECSFANQWQAEMAALVAHGIHLALCLSHQNALALQFCAMMASRE